MKKLLSITCLLLLLSISCSKTPPDEPVPGGTTSAPDTGHTAAPVVSMDSVYNYNDLKIFIVPGITWSCYRLDTLSGLPFLGSSGNGYSGNWQKRLVTDTVKASKYYTYSFDSSYETFTVKNTTTTIGDLKKYFFLSSSAGVVNYYSTTFTLMVIDSVHTLAYDTSKCAMISVYNKTRNTTDTIFVFLSRSCFAMLAPVTFITPYPAPGLPPNPLAPGYYTIDRSLPDFSILLSSFKHAGGFVFRDKFYSSDLSFSQSLSSGAGSGITHASEKMLFALSASKGLLLNTSSRDAGSPLGGHLAKTVRVNTDN